MLSFKSELIYSLLLLVLVFLLMFIIKRSLKKFSLLRDIDLNRKKIIVKLLSMFVYLIAFVGFSIIWGVDMKQFTVFISSVLAVLGVGFFAQWSILSNLTASIILFFSHPLRLGHRIKILDKDYEWTGTVIDITGFYLFMITDDGRKLTIPNYLVLQKSIEILETNKD